MSSLYSNPLELLGKYISFKSEDIHQCIGVVNSVTHFLDGHIEFSIDFNDYYDLSKISNLEILGVVSLA